MRRLLVALGAAGLIAVVAVGLSQSPGNHKPRPIGLGRAEVARLLRGSPPALAALHAQSAQIVGGGRAAFRARLRALRGHPVVINAWGAWCGPCRGEYPFLQSQSARLGRRVAFLGVDVADNRPAAEAFLKKFPVSYPSYDDPSGRLARDVGAGHYFPTTVFLDRTGGRSYVHQGAYRDERALARDIARYALGS
jgi:thiol-disulfide isomerase/thioredoxin